jgi:hypothetical protein
LLNGPHRFPYPHLFTVIFRGWVGVQKCLEPDFNPMPSFWFQHF